MKGMDFNCNIKPTMSTKNEGYVPAAEKRLREQKAKNKRPNSSFAHKINEGKKLFDGYGEARLIQKKLEQGVKGSGIPNPHSSVFS